VNRNGVEGAVRESGALHESATPRRRPQFAKEIRRDLDDSFVTVCLLWPLNAPSSNIGEGGNRQPDIGRRRLSFIQALWITIIILWRRDLSAREREMSLSPSCQRCDRIQPPSAKSKEASIDADTTSFNGFAARLVIGLAACTRCPIRARQI